MATKFLDSFDHYTTFTDKWTGVIALGGSWVIQAGSARTGVRGLAYTLPNTAFDQDAHAAIPGTANQPTYILGFAFRTTGFPGAGGQETIAGTGDAGTIQGSLGLDSVGRLTLWRGQTAIGALVATSVLNLLINTWYYIEFKHTVNNGAGVLEVLVNGVVWATFAGNTRVTANNFANQVYLGGRNSFPGGPVPRYDYDDIYLNDATGGAPNNTYWGVTQVECIKSSGAGTYTEFTNLVGAATHWQAVNEIPPDEDVSYVGSPTVDQRDTYAMSDLVVVSAQINAVQVVIRAKEDIAGVAAFARMYRRAGVDNQGADTPVGTDYLNYLEMMELDPIAAGAWTVANVNAAEFGARVR